MYILYGGAFTRALTVEMVLAEADLPYELREIDIAGGEHRSQAYRAICPTGMVPALITPDGETLYETPAICLALAERHDLTMLVPRADDPIRGRFLSAFFFVTGEIEPVMKRYFYPHRYVARQEVAPAMRQRSLEWALELMGMIEGQLQADGPYQLGKRYSLLDLMMTYWIGNISPADVLDRCPALLRCDALVRQRPKLIPHLERNEAMRAAYAVLQAKGEGVV